MVWSVEVTFDREELEIYSSAESTAKLVCSHFAISCRDRRLPIEALFEGCIVIGRQVSSLCPRPMGDLVSESNVRQW